MMLVPLCGCLDFEAAVRACSDAGGCGAAPFDGGGQVDGGDAGEGVDGGDAGEGVDGGDAGEGVDGGDAGESIDGGDAGNRRTLTLTVNGNGIVDAGSFACP